MTNQTSDQNFFKAFNCKTTDPLTRYAGTKIVFENPFSNEVFEGVVESNRDNEQLYVLVPALKNSVQRVYINDILAVVKHLDSVHISNGRGAGSIEVKSVTTTDAARRHRVQARKHFPFLPDGEPVAKLLNSARKQSKENKDFKHVKHMAILNDECQKRFNTCYSKLLPKAKKNSPFLYNDCLYVPFSFTPSETELNKNVIVYVSIGSEALTLSHSCHIPTPKDLHFKGESVTLSDIEMITINPSDTASNYGQYGQGWVIKPFAKGSNMPTPYYIITKVDEGIVADLWLEHHDGSVDCIDSSYEYTNDLISGYQSYKAICGKEIDANRACKVLGMNNTLENKQLIHANGIWIEVYTNELDLDHPPRFEALNEEGESMFSFDKLPSDLNLLTFEIAVSLAS